MSGLSLLTSAAGSCRAGCGWEDGCGGGDYRVKYVTRYDEVDKPDEATAALCVCLTPNKTQGPVITVVYHHYFIISKTSRLVVVSFPCYFCHTLCLPAELPVAVLSPEMSFTPPSGGCGLGVEGEGEDGDSLLLIASCSFVLAACSSAASPALSSLFSSPHPPLSQLLSLLIKYADVIPWRAPEPVVAVKNQQLNASDTR